MMYTELNFPIQLVGEIEAWIINQLIDSGWSNPLVQASKLISHILAQLI